MRIIYEKNFLCVDNYKQINEIKNDLIILQYCSIKGSNILVKYLDKDRLVLEGNIFSIEFKGDNNLDVQNQNEKK